MVNTKVKSTDVKDKAMYSELDTFLSDDSHKIKQLSKGEIVEGEIVSINNGVIVVDVGFKSEGIIAGKELKSEILDWTKLSVGDKILVYVVKPEDDKGQLVLSIRRTQQASAWLALENAKKSNEVVEATVVESNNGGLIVEIGKGIRGFIPTSQLDATRVYANGVRQVGKDISSRVQKRLNTLIGESIKTRIIELDREKNRIILSEKMVTQARDLEKRAQTLKKVKESDVLKGTVSGITPFGIFVNAQGLEGLVHLSELSWDKVEDIGAIYKVGDTVDVMVIGLSDGGKRVAYSVKRLQQDPWSQAISQFKVGDVVEGEIQKVVPYGAFVRIGEGLNGLIHISELSDKLVKNPEDIVKVGQEVKVKILSISSTERHLGLSLKSGSTVSAPAPKLNDEELAEALDAAIDSEIK
ncbi:hypothetical protein A3K02_01520 [candidate division WS6 bacterium RIFOXYD1_FULL_33_8]|nr:MAG: hypothetical protein A3K02_01520 [candidate division WS6 bacterium RIFOXYD1_FULL_33_8]